MNAALQQLFQEPEAEEAVLQDEDARLCGDPAICVSDLEKALESYIEVVGYRNLHEIIECIKDAKCTWKTAPKARA